MFGAYYYVFYRTEAFQRVYTFPPPLQPHYKSYMRMASLILYISLPPFQEVQSPLFLARKPLGKNYLIKFPRNSLLIASFQSKNAPVKRSSI